MAKHGHNNSKGRMTSVICRLFSVLILLFVIALLLPITIPKLFGYQIYSVVSGSMEPEIPVGSVVYVKEAEPLNLVPGDIIAFTSGDTVIIHRVVENNKLDGIITTKGDANEIEDFGELRYSDVLGRVERHYPLVGQVMLICSDITGKILLLCLALCGVLLSVLASRLGGKEEE